MQLNKVRLTENQPWVKEHAPLTRLEYLFSTSKVTGRHLIRSSGLLSKMVVSAFSHLTVFLFITGGDTNKHAFFFCFLINVDEGRILNVFIRDMKIASCYHQMNILLRFSFS